MSESFIDWEWGDVVSFGGDQEPGGSTYSIVKLSPSSRQMSRFKRFWFESRFSIHCHFRSQIADLFRARLLGGVLLETPLYPHIIQKYLYKTSIVSS